MLHLLGTKTCLHGRKASLKFRAVLLLLLCGGLLLSQVVTAQYSNPYGKVEMNRTDQDSKPYYFGMSIGINLARFQT